MLNPFDPFKDLPMINFESNVKTAELLNIVKSNYTRHKKIYKEAVEGFLVDARKKIGKELEQLKDNDGTQTVSLIINAPRNHNDTYETAIKMLELTTDEEVVLGYSDFNNLVMDKWNWQHSFLLSNSMYSNTASGCLSSF